MCSASCYLAIPDGITCAFFLNGEAECILAKMSLKGTDEYCLMAESDEL